VDSESAEKAAMEGFIVTKLSTCILYCLQPELKTNYNME